ncbi:hypothetical protein JCM8547_001575 [Rhodosporidiobolus lusitaniae]
MGKADDGLTLPSYDQATHGHPPPPPIEFHVYRSGSMFSKDDVVTGADKSTMLYHLDFPRKIFSGSWDLTLARGGPGGPPVAKIEKGHFGDSFDITMAIDGRQIRCQRTGFFSPKYQFGGAHNAQGPTEYYSWVPDGHFVHKYQYTLYRTAELESGKNKSECHVIARWRTPFMSVSKDGTLLIQPSHAHEQELILATALGVEAKEAEAELELQQEMEAQMPLSLPAYEETAGGSSAAASGAAGGEPVELHVYCDLGLKVKDNIVTGRDKQKILYHHHFPRKLGGRWDMRLTRGGPEGVLICTIEKGILLRDSFDINWEEEPKRKIHVERSGLPFVDARFEFTDSKGESLTWKADGIWTHVANYSLYRTADLKLPKDERLKKVLAKWRATSWAATKDGVLLIQPQYAQEQDLLLATALGVEERTRERGQA